MKIYTKGGDEGQTSLYGGKRVFKDDLRIECYGTVDELNSFIGLLASGIEESEEAGILLLVQKKLFDIGSVLAADPGRKLNLPEITEDDVIHIENHIDNMTANLEPLKTFILPGGSKEISYSHVCRTICRRAERRCISLQREAFVPSIIIKYLNRLSDFFFVIARKIAKDQGRQDIPWVPDL